MKLTKRLLLTTLTLLLVSSCSSKDDKLENFIKAYDYASVVSNSYFQDEMIEIISNLIIEESSTAEKSYSMAAFLGSPFGRAGGYLVHEYNPTTEATTGYITFTGALDSVNSNVRIEDNLLNIDVTVLGVNVFNIKDQTAILPKGNLGEIINFSSFKNIDRSLIKGFKSTYISSDDIKTPNKVHMLEIDSSYINEQTSSYRIVFTENPHIGFVTDHRSKILIGFTLVGKIKFSEIIDLDLKLVAIDIDHLQNPNKRR